VNQAFEHVAFWRQFLCDEDGTGSMSRLLTGLFGLTAIVCVMIEVWHTHAIPDATRLAGFAAFALAPLGTNYLHNATVVKFTQGAATDK
jgi:hypothetical protein